MIVIRYNPPQFARFYSGADPGTPLEMAWTADQRTDNPANKHRSIQDARLVYPPMSGTGYCMECIRKCDAEEIGMFHQGHLIDIRDMVFNVVEL